MTSPFFTPSLLAQIKHQFLQVDQDFNQNKRLYFDNGGGSLRLKKTIEQMVLYESIPDTIEREHDMAQQLQQIQRQGEADFRLMLNAHGGTIFTSLTASKAMFDIVQTIVRQAPGNNLVTTALEHPSAFDAMSAYARETGKTLRVIPCHHETGRIEVEDVVKQVDTNTALLNIIYSSNISGAYTDLESVVKAVRAINPDIYIVVDAVQYAPHDIIDLASTAIDAITIAPYKYYGCRGSGFAWLSDRVARLSHQKLAAKPDTEWELGSPAPWQFAVVSEIVSYVCWLGGHFSHNSDKRTLFTTGMQHIKRHEQALLDRLLEGSPGVAGLRHINGIKVWLDQVMSSQRHLVVSISFDHLDAAQAVVEYGNRGVTVCAREHSSLYSQRILASLQWPSVVRITPMHCHSPADIDRFLAITSQIAPNKKTR